MIGTKSREIQKAPGNSDYCLIDGALHRDRKKENKHTNQFAFVIQQEYHRKGKRYVHCLYTELQEAMGERQKRRKTETSPKNKKDSTI